MRGSSQPAAKMDPVVESKDSNRKQVLFESLSASVIYTGQIPCSVYTHSAGFAHVIHS